MVTAVCPANLLVSWTDLADEDLRASPQNSIYLVTFNSSLNGEMLEVPFSDGPMVSPYSCPKSLAVHMPLSRLI